MRYFFIVLIAILLLLLYPSERIIKSKLEKFKAIYRNYMREVDSSYRGYEKRTDYPVDIPSPIPGYDPSYTSPNRR